MTFQEWLMVIIVGCLGLLLFLGGMPVLRLVHCYGWNAISPVQRIQLVNPLDIDERLVAVIVERYLTRLNHKGLRCSQKPCILRTANGILVSWGLGGGYLVEQQFGSAPPVVLIKQVPGTWDRTSASMDIANGLLLHFVLLIFLGVIGLILHKMVDLSGGAYVLAEELNRVMKEVHQSSSAKTVQSRPTGKCQ